MNVNFSVNDFIDKYGNKTAIFMLLVTVVSAFILFAPKNILNILHLAVLSEKFGMYFGLVFIVSIFFDIYFLIFSPIKQKIDDYKFKKTLEKVKESLTTLEPIQKCIICKLYLERSHTKRYSLSDSVINTMYKLGIVYPTTNVAELNPFANKVFVPIGLQKWVIDELNNNPELKNHFMVYSKMNDTLCEDNYKLF